MTAPENVILNGVMMGLSRREAQRRLDAVLDFAELADFTELKLKNYSSGMIVRLAFAVMVQADSDIMLIDEVLAVGDAAFAQRCLDVFQAKRDAGKTIVFVTHDMITLQAFCHRVLVLDEGEQRFLGDPEEAAMEYYRLNFTLGDGSTEPAATSAPGENYAGVVDAWLSDDAGKRVENVEQGRPINLNVVIEAREDLERPVFGFHFLNRPGVAVFSFNRPLTVADGRPDRLAAGERVRISGRVENPLLPGSYFVNCWIWRHRHDRDTALQIVRLLEFVVYGNELSPGVVSVDADVQIVPEGA
jgi:energy-coupling factor transporter ATP-binding protein EcfA2